MLCRYTVERGLRVPMRDGVELVADHYAPARPVGTVLVRTPYGRGFPFTQLFGTFLAAHGYHVLIQSVRGTFGSGGRFTPMVHEAADGADTAAWLTRQPWFTGAFATIGMSYLGYVQWALLRDPPPACRAAVVIVGPHDFAESTWGTGAFTLNDFLAWSDMMAHQEDPGRLRRLVRRLGAGRRVARAAGQVPAGAAARALLGTGAPWYEDWAGHPDPDDPFWTPMRHGEALDRVEIPVLLFGGWQDLFLRQTLAQYRRLRDRGVPVALTVGSWTHNGVLTAGLATVLRESLAWLDTHLAGTRRTTRGPVRVHVTRHGWIDLPDWPPALPQRQWHPAPGGALADAPPPAGAAPVSFTFDPADPTPTVGGRLLEGGGYRVDTRLAVRPDVAVFTGAPLAADLFVLGTPVLELRHDCDNPHHDLFVRVSDVDTRGRSRNVADGYLGRAPGTPTLRIELDPVAYRFRAGHRIRVLVAGGCHPRYGRNLGSGEPLLTGRTLVPATHTVHLADGASRLLLPAGTSLPRADA